MAVVGGERVRFEDTSEGSLSNEVGDTVGDLQRDVLHLFADRFLRICAPTESESRVSSGVSHAGDKHCRTCAALSTPEPIIVAVARGELVGFGAGGVVYVDRRLCGVRWIRFGVG